MKYLCVLAGSAAGGLARFLLSRWIYSLSAGNFPTGTMVINLSGCFIIGFLSGLFEYRIVSPNLRLFIFVGFLGGYTTFSTFGLETFSLLKETEIRMAMMNISISVILGIVLVFAGFITSQFIMKSFR